MHLYRSVLEDVYLLHVQFIYLKEWLMIDQVIESGLHVCKEILSENQDSFM